MRTHRAVGLMALVLGCGSPNESGISKEPGSAGASGRSGLEVMQGGSGGAQKCTRVESISALAIERPEPFDVVIVADHSGSLSWSRDSLSAGLKNLLAYAHGQEVRFYVLTPTQYGASSEAAGFDRFTPLVNWKDPVTNKPYLHAITEFTQVCTDLTGAAFDCAKREEAKGKGITIKGSWEFQMPLPIAAITPDMTSTQIAEQQQKIADGILALGSDGAQVEQPICTLNRYISQNTSLLPKHAVFVILSDEDDQSTPAECLLSYDYRERAEGTNDAVCTQNCDVYRYEALYIHPSESVEYDCVPLDDQGVPHPESGKHYSTSSSAGPVCTPGSVGPCGSYELDLANQVCKDGHVPQNCQATCTAGSGYLCTLERPTASPDLCTNAFSADGASYSNFSDYCQRKFNSGGPFKDCKATGYKLGVSPRYLGKETVTPLVDVPTLADMAHHFRRTADAVFGPDEYFVESIVLDPAFNCAVNSGQSYGTILKSLATSSADVFPLCSDYAPALQRIQSFAKRLVQNELPLKLASDEEVDAVTVIDVDGKRRMLAETDFTYDREHRQLVVTPGALGPSDLTLDLTVADTCVEIVR